MSDDSDSFVMIREMTEKDLDKVGNLYKDANKFTTKDNILNWTKKDLDNFPQYHLVFEKDHRILGAISGTLRKKIANIEDIATNKSYRGKRIGSELIKFLINRFKKNGVKRVKLWVHWANTEAIPFYYKHSFKIIKFQRTNNIKDIPDGEDILILERVLSQ
jgi:ribosomal protein S18 acetylase RimI-like enzyme